MALNRPPAFQFYCKDWLSDAKVRRLSYETKGIYIELLAIMWNEGKDSVVDDRDLPRVLGITPKRWANTRSQLQKPGKEIFEQKGNKLISKKLKKIRAELNRFRRQKQLAGIESGKARQAKALRAEEEANRCSPSVDVSLERNRTLQSSSSIPISIKLKPREERH